jgi:hypothetical protein
MAGETVALGATAWRDANVVPAFKGPTLHIHEVTATYSATNQLELNDVMELCYLPPGIKVWEIQVAATDMDTHVSPTLAQKITIGSTDVVTGITAGQSGANTGYPLATAYTTSAIELVKITNTAASATAATGSLKVRFLYTAP